TDRCPEGTCVRKNFGAQLKILKRKTRTDHGLHQPDKLTCYLQNQVGHGTAGAGEEVISLGRTSDSSSGVTRSIGSVRVFVKTSTASWANPDKPDAKDFTGI